MKYCFLGLLISTEEDLELSWLCQFAHWVVFITLKRLLRRRTTTTLGGISGIDTDPKCGATVLHSNCSIVLWLQAGVGN